MIIIYGIGILVLVVLMFQLIILYRLYRIYPKKKANLKINTESKEWIAFEDLFKNHKLKFEGYISVLSGGHEQVFMYYNCGGCSWSHKKGKLVLSSIHFENDGYYYEGASGEKEIGRIASYNLDMSEVVSITSIEKYCGEYEDKEDNYYVECTLKDNKVIQVIFCYEDYENIV